MLHYILNDQSSSLHVMLIQTLHVILMRGNLLRLSVHAYGRSYKLGFKTSNYYGFIYDRSRIHDNCTDLQKSYLNQKVIERV